jgi:DNA-binding beta-propeller fold protein YncE
VFAFTINTTTGGLKAMPGSPFATGGSAPTSVAIDASGKFLYITNLLSNTISAFSIGSNGGLVAVSGSPFPAGTGPISVAAAPSGEAIYVANQGANSISKFALSASGVPSEAGSPLPVGRGPVFVAPDIGGNFVFVGNGLSGNLSELSASSSGSLTNVAQSPYATPATPTSLITTK